jgi:hypothetical protein
MGKALLTAKVTSHHAIVVQPRQRRDLNVDHVQDCGGSLREPRNDGEIGGFNPATRGDLVAKHQTDRCDWFFADIYLNYARA